MFNFDKDQKIREFKILSRGIADHMSRRIISWLEQHVDDEILQGFDHRILDADDFHDVVNISINHK